MTFCVCVCECVGAKGVTSDLLMTAAIQKVVVILGGRRLQRLWRRDLLRPGGVEGRHLQDVVEAAVRPIVGRRLQAQHI